MIETGLVLSFGPPNGVALAPQVTAPPPLDLFHDLRWVSVYHNSWITLALELAGIVVLRSLWVAWVVQRAWPEDRLPPMGPAVRRVAVYHAVGMVLFVPWVVLLFGLAFSHLSFLFFAAIPPALALAAAIHQGAARQAVGHWWQWRPTWRGVGWILASFVWLTAAGGLMSNVPPPVAVLVAGITGLANARAWYGLVRSLALRPHRRPLRALAPALVAGILAIVVGGSTIGFAVTMRRDDRTVGLESDRPPGRYPVLIAAGLHSRLESRPPLPLPEGYVGWRYSYRGLDDRGVPLPYGPTDTQQSLITSARRMAEQVSALWKAYGEPVTIVAESEGALVARVYLVRMYRPQEGRVARLISLDMPSGVSLVSFPPRGEEGWGVASGWGLRGLADVLGAIAPLDLDVDSPLGREFVDCRTQFQRIADTPLPPDVREVSFLALADWVDPPDGVEPGSDSFIVTAPHGGLVARSGVQQLIVAILRGDSTTSWSPEPASTLARMVSAASRPWHVPALDSDLAAAEPCPA
jgi:hypothetical protein